MAQATEKKEGGNGGIAGGGSIKNKALHSYWLEGADQAKTIKDQFGKSIDQILGQIKEKQLTKIESAFKDYTKGDGGLLGKFLSNFKLGGMSLSMDQIKAFADEAKSWASAAQQGLEMYKEFKEGNFEALLGKLGPHLGDGFMDMAQWGMAAYDGIKNTDWRDFNSVLGLVSKLTGVDVGQALGITQLQAEITSLLALAQKYNVAGAIGMLRDKLKGRPDINQQMLLGMGINARLSQIETMEEMLKILGGPAVLLMNPGIIRDILGNYRLPSTRGAVNLDQERARLINVLTQIDPNWDKENIGNQIHYKLEPWQRASQDAITLFNDHPIYGVPCCIGKNYPEITLKDGLNNTYKYLNLK